MIKARTRTGTIGRARTGTIGRARTGTIGRARTGTIGRARTGTIANIRDYTGQVVLVTGAGRGAGRLLAEAFAARGALVAANDISPVNVEMVVAGITTTGGRARAYIHDIAKKVDVQAMVNNIMDDYGRIDILINSANVLLPTSLLDIDEWDLHRVFEVNAIGTFLMMQSVGRVMRTQAGGIIVNIVKIPANAPASFIASRAGLAAMTARIQEELSQSNIRVFSYTGKNPIEEVLASCQPAVLV